jgi:hypothetical protein
MLGQVIDDEIEACFYSLRDLKRDEVAIPPLAGKAIAYQKKAAPP